MAHNEQAPNQDVSEQRLPARGGAVTNVLVTVVMVVALAAGVYALTRLDTWGDSTAAVPQRFQLDLERQTQIPAELLTYREQSQFDTTLESPHALAVSADGTILVAGDRSLVRLSAAGQVLANMALKEKPTCVAVSMPEAEAAEQIYVGCGARVSVLSAQGEPIAEWPELGPRAVLTAIAAGPEHVYVADAGQRVVHILDRTGRAIGTVGRPDPDRTATEFIIPSPCFDLTVTSDGMLWVVNPGKRRVESYTETGELQSMWGQGGSQLRDFFGCCNPAHLALLPDGRFLTAEKGIPRIKIYTSAGDLEQVVAGPRELGVSTSALGDARSEGSERVFDVAAAPDGAVVVLDPRARSVRVFVRREAEAKQS